MVTSVGPQPVNKVLPALDHRSAVLFKGERMQQFHYSKIGVTFAEGVRQQ